jgi:3-phenylpropionate/cinnamic acid dioxygenase small subunit
MTGPVSADLNLEIQQFLVDEAALLDDRRFADWFALLTEDVSYRVTARVARDTADGAQEYEIIDEDKELLKLRVDQLGDPRLTRAENPPSFYRRFVSNFRIELVEPEDRFSVTTNLLVYKNRPSTDVSELYAGERRDRLHRLEGKLFLESRLVRLDHAVLAGGTLSTLF